MLFQHSISVLPFLLGSVAALELLPVTNLADVTGISSPSKRASSTDQDLTLKDTESFLWAAPAGENLIYANLTVYYPEEYENIISMERFAGKLKSVNCAEDMMLEFTDKAAFDYAQDVWKWVNDDVNNTFIMVTNYEGCADDKERLPFAVSNIRYDEQNLKAHLTADQKEWEEVAHSYDLHVGHLPLTPAQRALLVRDVDYTMNLESSFDKNLFSTTVGGWTTSVDANVRTFGKMNVEFDVSVKLLSLKSASATINPVDVGASVELALTESGTLAQAFNWQKTIISIPIKGVEIKKVVKLGAFLDVDVGFSSSKIAGEAHAKFGARADISNSAVVVVDLVKSDNNKFSGWAPTFKPTPFSLDAKVDGSAQVFAKPNVKLEASALSKGYNIALGLKLPYIAADFAAKVDSNGGICSTKKTVGVDFKSKIGVDLAVAAAKKGEEGSPFWSKQLYANEWDLYSQCFAFGPDAAKRGLLN